MPLGKHNTMKLCPPAPSWRPTGAVSSAFSPVSNTSTPEHNSPGFVPLLCRRAVCIILVQKLSPKERENAALW